MRSKSVLADDKAAVSDIVRLERVARVTAVRIHKSGWPSHQIFPPFIKRRRGGRAVVWCASSLEPDGSVELGPQQVFIWIKGSGPWLGEDGMMYIMTPNPSGTQFVRYTPAREEISRSRIDKIIACLEKLEY